MKKLLTVTLFSGLLTLLRMASGFLIAKVVAVYTGPSGMAMLGQVQSLVAALTGLVCAPTGSGLVRFTAENHSKGFDACSPWWRASIKWSLFLLLFIIPLTCIVSQYLAQWLFGGRQYAWLVVLAALLLPFSVINAVVTSVINGQQQYRRFILLGMVSVLVSTILMITLIVSQNLKGALIAAVLSTSISGVVMLMGSLKQPWLHLKYWWGATKPEHIKDIGGYALMAITTALMVPISLIFVRNILVAKVGWEQAGQWQAVWKISEVYLGVITMALGTYYLPKLATLHGSEAIIKEIKSTAKIIMPVVVISALIVFFLRDIAISLLFTEAFRPARDLFAVQLVGDVIKILAWLFAYPMLSRGATKWFMASEIFFSITFIILSYFLIDFAGAHGANMAYLVNYCGYLFFVFLNLNKFSK